MASEAVRHADAAFREAFQSLQASTAERGTLDDCIADIRATLSRIEAIVLANGRQLSSIGAELRTLRERLEQPPTP